MAALGDKIGSTILAQAAGVPTIPWSGDGVAIRYEGGWVGGWVNRHRLRSAHQSCLQLCPFTPAHHPQPTPQLVHLPTFPAP